MPAFSFSVRVSRIPAGAGTICRTSIFVLSLCRCARQSGVTPARTRRVSPVEFSFNLAKTFYASTASLSTRNGRVGPLSGLVRDVSTANARRAKELRQRKAGDQRAATNAGYEEDEFFGDNLHSNSCGDEDKGRGTLLPLASAVFIGAGSFHD